MVFSSNEFLFLYLPLSFILYFLSPIKYRNIVLFAVSLVFYGWEKPIYLLIMIFIIIVNYLFGYLIDRAGENAEKKKTALILGVVINLTTLGFFKYTDFLILSLSKIPFLSFLEPIGIQLPIGISFYQILDGVDLMGFEIVRHGVQFFQIVDPGCLGVSFGVAHIKISLQRYDDRLGLRLVQFRLDLLDAFK